MPFTENQHVQIYMQSAFSMKKKKRCNDLFLDVWWDAFEKFMLIISSNHIQPSKKGYSLLLEIAITFLAWEISPTEEPGGLQSTGSQNMT